MKEFIMLFRDTTNPQNMEPPSPAAMEAEMKKWGDWIGGIAAQGKYVGGEQLNYDGKTLKPNNVVTDGPYAEIKEILGGYVIVKAADVDEALEMAKGCPVFETNGNVEIRSLMKTDA